MQVKITDRHRQFILDLEKSVTLISGYSGEGKTYIYNLVKNKDVIPIQIRSNLPVIAATKGSGEFDEWYGRYSQYIIFVDDTMQRELPRDFIAKSIAKGSYCVVFSRELSHFNVDLTEVFKLWLYDDDDERITKTIRVSDK